MCNNPLDTYVYILYIYIHNKVEMTNKFTGMFHLQLGHYGYDLTTCLEWPWRPASRYSSRRAPRPKAGCS